MIPTPEDHVEITQLLARYCLTLDHDDIDGWVALFTDDAAYEVYGRTFTGHDGLHRLMTGAPRGLHLGGTPVIDMVDADHATTVQNLLFVPTDGFTRSAVYTDQLVRTSTGWRIAARRCRFIVADGLADKPDR